MVAQFYVPYKMESKALILDANQLLNLHFVPWLWHKERWETHYEELGALVGYRFFLSGSVEQLHRQIMDSPARWSWNREGQGMLHAVSMVCLSHDQLPATGGNRIMTELNNTDWQRKRTGNHKEIQVAAPSATETYNVQNARP